jgi:N-acetyl-gamma-glutamyl-phosphate/LysW-gamma-L-alpha-aminoadipyl-6-phosphate reductase
VIEASIVGASGYGGGELLRLLLGHPDVSVRQVTSRQQAGKYVHGVHPNLRGHTTLQFTTPDQLEPCDVLFLGLPHGSAAGDIERYASLAPRVIDLSADFRLRDAAEYLTWYDWTHPTPAWLDRFVYGLPETRREALRGATHVSGVGCNATATILALLPLARAGLIERAVVDLKVGSSEGGATGNPGSHHPERVGAVRTFAPAGHRHVAEVRQELGTFELHFTATAIEMVRGVVCTAHVFVRDPLEDKDCWKIFRQAYGAEPFVRLVKERTGIFRFPEPKILAGSNHADVGFQADPEGRRVVVISAIDNLMKGAAGSAVQCMNLMCGFDETAGLAFPGLHP